MKYWADGEIVKEPVTGNAHSRGDRQRSKQNGSFASSTAALVAKRNPRNVLSPPPSPWGGDHYAAFPPELIRGLILAAVPRWACPECGTGWAAVVEQPDFSQQPERQTYKGAGVPDERGYKTSAGQAWQDWRTANPNKIHSYRPTCQCGREDSVPGLLLDPFCGTGTSGEVARECLVRFVGCDISHEYLEQQAMWRSERRVSAARIETLPLFAEVT